MLERLIVRLIGDGASYRTMMDQSTDQTSRFEGALAGASKRIQSIGAGIASAGRRATVGLTLPIVGLGTAAVNSAVKMEKLQTALEVLTGSAEEGQQAFKRLQEFSANTPFQLEDLVNVNNMLLGFGQSTDDAFKSLQMLADVSAVTGSDLGRVAIAFGQSAAAGRVMTQDLNQFVNNGIPIYQLLGEVTGKTAAELRDMASEGKLSFDILNQAFTKATSQGGLFFQGTARLAETTGGKISTLKDNFTLMLAAIGELLAEGLNPLIVAATKIAQKISSWDRETQVVAVSIAAVTATVGPLLTILGPLIGLIGKAITIIGSWGGSLIALLNPVTAVIAVIIATAAALRVYGGSWENAGKLAVKAIGMMVNGQIFAFRTIRRLTVALAGWFVGRIRQMFTVEFVKAVIDGLRVAAQKLDEFAQWAVQRLRAMFTGEGVLSLEDFLKTMSDDLAAGFNDPNFLNTAANIVGDEVRRMNERNAAFGEMVGTTNPPPVETKVVETDTNRANDVMSQIKDGIGKLVDIGAAQLDKAPIEFDVLGLQE